MATFMAGFSDSVGTFHDLILQQSIILLDKMDIDKVQLWGHNLQLIRGDKLQYMLYLAYHKISQIAIISYCDNIELWGV